MAFASMAACVVLATGDVCTAQTTLANRYTDTIGDVRLRRIDGGSSSAVEPSGHRMPDIIVYEYGRWAPSSPAQSLFRGAYGNNGDFFRLDLTFEGLINPPGPLDVPFMYGPNPVMGFVEIDVDGNVDTGGETALPQFRYLGAVARFGGIPYLSRFAGRTARDGCPGTFDGDISTGPYFPERSGEDFHLYLHHSNLTVIDVGSNGTIQSFNSGDCWLLTGPFFIRSNGYSEFSMAVSGDGSYIAYDSQLQWDHDANKNRTTVSLVYPLTNAGSAAALGESTDNPEPLDGDSTNQNSIEEALDDLVFSALFASESDRDLPNFPLIEDWQFQAPQDHLNPQAWRVTMTFIGFFYDQLSASQTLAFTDVAPNVIRGDFNGDRVVDSSDIALFGAFRAETDGGPCDEDAMSNGVVTVPDFGNNFTLFDITYDGLVDNRDRPLLSSAVAFDGDIDGDVDLRDYAKFQLCFTGNSQEPITMACTAFDDDKDGDVDLNDWSNFTGVFVGPTLQADEPTPLE